MADARVAVVTGAARGIGRAVADGLAGAGYTVVCAARTMIMGESPLPGSLAETVARIGAAGGSAHAVRCDVTVPDGVDRLFDAVRTIGGGPDVLVHAAMSRVARPLGELDLASWRLAVGANMDALYLLCDRAATAMSARGGGSIVCLTSGMADHGRHLPSGYVGYAVAKAAMERTVTALAPQLSPLGIAINALRPGAVRTEYVEAELGAEFDFSGWREPASVVPAVLFLADQRGDGLTGQIVEARAHPPPAPPVSGDRARRPGAAPP